MHDHKEIIKLICDFMGEDLDGEACREVQEHLLGCPACRVYFDTVKRTVTLVRQQEKVNDVPGEVQERLYKVLNLQALKRKL